MSMRARSRDWAQKHVRVVTRSGLAVGSAYEREAWPQIPA